MNLQGRSLTEFPGIGPYLERIICRWLVDSPPLLEPPDIRRHFLTIPRARILLAAKPNWLKDLKGDLQMHTNWSDGSGTIRAMAESAQKNAYEYIAVTDHAKGLKIAGGIDESQLRQQAREIEQVNGEFCHQPNPLRVLHSIELNLNPKGEGDLAPAALRQLDVVLGAFHSALRKTEDQTERYLAALRNPYVHILAHPRGRIFNFRLGLRADWSRVFDLAATLNKAVEVDAYPDRQDLDVELLQIARAAGVRISLGTDAHHPWQLRFIELGLAAALLAKIPRERILNFMSASDLCKWTGALNKR